MISQSNILMAAPSSTPRDRHLVRDPRKQTATARSKGKASFKRIQRKTSEKLRSHVSKSIIILLLLLLLAGMTYNQVQSFQINDYANHYEDIEITGYRAIYSKSIAGRRIARLISWLGTAGPIDCFNKSVSDCYIRVYRSF